jgi:hypothetical protein
MQVRVSRQRILESAAKIMELYAGSRTSLEIEYFGEVRHWCMARDGMEGICWGWQGV